MRRFAKIGITPVSLLLAIALGSLAGGGTALAAGMAGSGGVLSIVKGTQQDNAVARTTMQGARSEAEGELEEAAFQANVLRPVSIDGLGDQGDQGVGSALKPMPIASSGKAARIAAEIAKTLRPESVIHRKVELTPTSSVGHMYGPFHRLAAP